MTGATWAPGERRRAGLLAAAVLGAVLYPLRQYLRPAKQRVDGFPLSYYPMFSAHRCQQAKVTCAVGVLADGTRRYLPSDVLGPGGLNQVRRQLKRVVREDRVEQFTEALAARLGAERGFEDVVRVEIVRAEFDLDVCLLTRQVQGVETVLAGADLPGVVELTAASTALPASSDLPGPPA